jgi:alpha-mannosidase
MKRWNRLNETLAEAAEKASVAAHLLVRRRIRARKSTAHGSLCSARKCMTSCRNERAQSLRVFLERRGIAMNCFASVLEDAVGGVARALDTQTDGVPLVVFNPLSIDREDLVEAEVEFPEEASPGF